MYYQGTCGNGSSSSSSSRSSSSSGCTIRAQVGTVVIVVVVVEVVVVDVLLGHRWGQRARFLSLTHNLAHTDNLGRSKLGVGQ